MSPGSGRAATPRPCRRQSGPAGARPGLGGGGRGSGATALAGRFHAIIHPEPLDTEINEFDNPASRSRLRRGRGLAPSTCHRHAGCGGRAGRCVCRGRRAWAAQARVLPARGGRWALGRPRAWNRASARVPALPCGLGTPRGRAFRAAAACGPCLGCRPAGPRPAGPAWHRDPLPRGAAPDPAFSPSDPTVVSPSPRPEEPACRACSRGTRPRRPARPGRAGRASGVASPAASSPAVGISGPARVIASPSWWVFVF